LLASIVESSDLAIAATTPEGTILSWNRAAEALFGYTADEIIGQSICDLAPPDHLDEVTQRSRQGPRRGISRYETVRLAKDGRP